MKKSIILLLAMLLFLASCSTDKNPNSPNTKESSSDDTADIDDNANKSSMSNLTMVNHEGCATDNGFYYLKNITADSGGYSLVMFLDKASMLEIPLCNKPNCKHKEDTCNAFVEGGSMGNYLFTDHSKLYLISSGSGMLFGGDMEGGFEITDSYGSKMSSSPPKIVSFNLDGTNRAELMVFDSGVRLESPFVLSGGKLYCVKAEMKAQKIDGSASSIDSIVAQNEELVCIDLDKKSKTPICAFKDHYIVGVCDNKLVIERLHSSVNPDTIDFNNDAEFLKYYNDMDRTILTFDVNTKEEKIVVTGKTTQIDGLVYGDGLVCYFDGKEKKVKKVDLSTSEIADVPIQMIKSRPTLSKIIDGKLIYEFYEDKQVNAEMERAFYHDFSTGGNKELTLYVKSGDKMTVPIINTMNDEFLVIPKYDEEKETTWAGTVQYNRTRQYYALIKKSDYWKSKTNYAYFEEE